MFGEKIEFNEKTLGIVEQIGRHMPGGFFIYKAAQPEQLVYANQAVFDIFGCKDLEEFKELTGYTFKGMLHPDDYAAISDSIVEQIDNNDDNIDYVEYRIIRKDGAVRWVDDFGHFTETEAYGGIYYVFISDITEKRERMETDKAVRQAVIEALSESYHTVWLINDVETGTFSLYRGDVEGNTIHALPIRDALNQMKYPMAKDYYIKTTVAPEDRERLNEELALEKIAKRLSEKPQFIVNYLRLMDDGSKRYFRIEFAKVDMPGGKLGVVCGFKDVDDEIREQQAIQKALREAKKAKEENKRLVEEIESAAKLADLMGSVASLLTNMPAMSFSKDAETGKYLACNQSFAEYAHKKNPEGVIGLTDHQIFDEVTASHFVEDDKKALSMDSPYIFFEDVPDAKGTLRNLQTTKMKFTDSNGRLCTLGMCVDVTEMTRIKSAEAEARIKHQELEEKISLQEKLLEQSESLREALQAAEEANKAKTNFLSNMSHEIRTPITAILGMNELIRRESKDRNVLEYSNNIGKAGTSLLGIINDILDFSKIEAGRMELVNVDYETCDLAADLINLTRFRAEEKGLILRTEIDTKLPAVLNGDELRIKQIITNLLSNAVKYTEKGNITLAMKLAGIENGTADIFVSVTDTGIGIKQEESGKLFSAFDRLDVIRTRSIEGTGLGLAITSKMLELMDSRLHVESTYGKGSAFFFTVRQQIVDDTEVGEFDPLAVVEKNAAIHEESTYFMAPDAHVLIVDDTPLNLQVIVGLLKRTGVQIDTASSGRECIEKFGSSKHYDMVFLDYRMPQMDGIETLNKLHELYPEKASATPIICLTASAITGDREKMISAGFNDYLSKPVNISKMEGMMRKYLPQGKIEDAVLVDDNSEDEELALLPKEIFGIKELDPKAGIEFCGDAEDYMAAIEIYEASVKSKADDIAAAYEKEDNEAYVTMVHSLKSTSRAIGAKKLSELALTLEQAGRTGDIGLIKEKTPELLEMYRKLGERLSELVG